VVGDDNFDVTKGKSKDYYNLLIRGKAKPPNICWRAVARQLTILYNSKIWPKSVRCKIVDLRSRLRFFISGHSGMHVNAPGNIDQLRRPAPLENKDTINEVKYRCL